MTLETRNPTVQQRALTEVSAQASAMAEALLASTAPGDRAMGVFVSKFLTRIAWDGSAPSINGIVALPVLVFGAETGEPMRATPLALIHTLWWASARYLDDVMDAPRNARSDATELNCGMMTAIAVGNYLPLSIFGDLAVSDAVRYRLVTEYGNGSLDALGGQLSDLVLDAETATVDDVLCSYQGKTGAPYGMAAALAAHLAGCDTDRVDAWRQFGRRLGVLRQLVNDQRDLATCRDEDLSNGTATYLFVHLLGGASAARRAELVDLHRRARASVQARAELRQEMLAPEVVSGYAETIRPIVRTVRDSLVELGGEPRCLAELAGVIDETVSLFPQFHLADGADDGEGHQHAQ